MKKPDFDAIAQKNPLVDLKRANEFARSRNTKRTVRYSLMPPLGGVPQSPQQQDSSLVSGNQIGRFGS